MDSGSDNMSAPPAKKVCKKSKFYDIWLHNPEFVSWLEKCDNLEKARCKICEKIIIANKTNLHRHKDSSIHQQNVQILQEVAGEGMSRAGLFNDSLNVKKAELRFCLDVVEHDRSFSSYGHFVTMLQKVLPDSEIAKSVTLKKSKMSALITNVINSYIQSDTAKKLRSNFFSIMLEESIDNADTKNLVFLARFVEADKIYTSLIDCIRVKERAAEHLFKCLQLVLEKHALPISNIVGISIDNANMMVGKHNSLVSRLLNINKEIAVFPSVCHSIHLVAHHACNHLPPYIETFLNKMYTYFSRSLLRRTMSRKTQQLMNIMQHKIIEPCPTRWLALSECIKVILQQWTGLFSVFAEANTHSDSSEIVVDIYNIFENRPLIKAYLQFLRSVLGEMAKFNLIFQSNKMLLHDLLPSSNRLLRFMGDSFIKPHIISTAELHTINIYDEGNLLATNEIILDDRTLTIVNDIKNSNRLEQSEIEEFYINIKQFYKEAYKGMVEKLPFKEKLLQALDFLDPNVALNLSSHRDQMYRILDKFPSKFNSDDIFDEWRRLGSYFEPAKKTELCQLQIPTFWHSLRTIKDHGGQYEFHNIVKLAELCMSLPHSSADVERFFSSLRHIRKRNRNKLETQMISALTRIKLHLMSSGVNCANYELPPDMLALFNYKMYAKEHIPQEVNGVLLPDETESSDSDYSDVVDICSL
nr:uncharacterized protein LOC117227702 [Megalopta genalis]